MTGMEARCVKGPECPECGGAFATWIFGGSTGAVSAITKPKPQPSFLPGVSFLDGVG